MAERNLETRIQAKQLELQRLQLEVDRAESKLKFTRDEFHSLASANQSAGGTVSRSDMRRAEQAAEEAVFDLRRAQLDLHAVEEELQRLQKTEN